MRVGAHQINKYSALLPAVASETPCVSPSILSLRTIHRSFTGKFQTAVRTVLPFQVT
jgi:hypothetical protein